MYQTREKVWGKGIVSTVFGRIKDRDNSTIEINGYRAFYKGPHMEPWYHFRGRIKRDHITDTMQIDKTSYMTFAREIENGI